ncbi:50S ribosomal protein L9 [Candidatus Aerophobetes bacterium]|nr:50S ribosomal protein L9 [Candidatus Aerophobetes bacterium]
MKVILEQSLENLGNKDEIVEVSDGYARNFLIPKKLALRATPSEIKQLEERKKIIQKKREREKFKAIRIQERLKGTNLVIERDVGEGGKLFGSVTTQDVAQQIKRKFNLEIDHRKIILDEPIRVIGIRRVFIKLHPEVEISLQVEVKKKNEK